jgi:hypothetical protein
VDVGRHGRLNIFFNNTEDNYIFMANFRGRAFSPAPLFVTFRLPTDVQAEAIPLILGGGDVLMAAETGSGKTGAFCLPIIQIVWETLKDLEAGKGSKIIAQICKC